MTLPNFSSVFKKLRSSASIDPERDWLLILIGSAILLLGILIWNVWTFHTVANGGALGGRSQKTEALFNQSALDAIRATFDARASEESKYVTGAYHFSDPSQ